MDHLKILFLVIGFVALVVDAQSCKEITVSNSPISLVRQSTAGCIRIRPNDSGTLLLLSCYVPSLCPWYFFSIFCPHYFIATPSTAYNQPASEITLSFNLLYNNAGFRCLVSPYRPPATTTPKPTGKKKPKNSARLYTI